MKISHHSVTKHGEGVGDMDSFTFGMTMTIVGMGSTLLSLWVLTLLVNLLKRLFPYKQLNENGKEAKS